MSGLPECARNNCNSDYFHFFRCFLKHLHVSCQWKVAEQHFSGFLSWLTLWIFAWNNQTQQQQIRFKLQAPPSLQNLRLTKRKPMNTVGIFVCFKDPLKITRFFFPPESHCNNRPVELHVIYFLLITYTTIVLKLESVKDKWGTTSKSLLMKNARNTWGF